jgi:uncharacterized membrane protein YhaH (DUF805 family)
MFFLKLFFSFQGRINRVQYWSGNALVNLISYAVFNIVATPLAAGRMKTPQEIMTAFAGMGLILGPVLMVAGISQVSIQVKRFHDRGRSGWFAAIGFAPILIIPTIIASAAASGASFGSMIGMVLPVICLFGLIGVFMFIDLALMPGQDGPNRFGPPPGGGLTAGLGPSPSSGPIDWDGAGPRPANRSLESAEAALARAIAERRSGASQPAPAPAPAQPRFVPPGAAPAPSGFGRRGL